jgi:hypothetical protein
MAGYNGWRNYETWNVALWMQNDEGLYQLFKEAGSYAAGVETLRESGMTETPDGISWTDSGLDLGELEECVTGFKTSLTSPE